MPSISMVSSCGGTRSEMTALDKAIKFSVGHQNETRNSVIDNINISLGYQHEVPNSTTDDCCRSRGDDYGVSESNLFGQISDGTGGYCSGVTCDVDCAANESESSRCSTTSTTRQYYYLPTRPDYAGGGD